MVSFALKTLISDRGKLLTGLAGVVFSLVLVNVQGGLYFGLMRRASLLVEHCDADLWVGQKHVESVDTARDIPEIWINRIRGLPEVESATSCIVANGTARLPDGRMEDIRILGSDPTLLPGMSTGFVAGTAADLQRPGAVSFDEADDTRFGRREIGDRIEINGQSAQIAARTRGISGSLTMPYLVATTETARRLSRNTPGACSFFLIKVRSGCDVATLQNTIRQRLPDTAVFTSHEFASMSQEYWMKRTGIGTSFGSSTVLGLAFALVMIGRSLYTLTLDHVHDYATLKALGAEDRHVCGVIIVQSLSIACAGSLAGVLIVAAIRKLWSSPLAPIVIPPSLICSAVALVFLICLAASLLPYVRFRRIDAAVTLT